MSLPYPRRVKDLPTLDFYEEINTPQKTHADKNEINNKNESQNKDSYGTNTSRRMFPRRTSELPKLDDSDLDDSLKIDNLNCAILNDSFILSPCKNEHNEGISAAETPAGKLLRKNAENASDENMSFVAHFNNLALNSQHEETPESSKQQTQQKPSTQNSTNQSYRQGGGGICSQTPLEIIDENEQLENGGTTNTQNCNTSQKRRVIETPYRPMSNVKITSAATTTSTATKTATTSTTSESSQFATPQIRSFSIQKRPRDLCSTQSQKSRAAMVNEFRSQKVLFQTPIALSRVPLACLPNDSVTLSVCDTINESGGNTPNTVEKTPPPPSQKDENRDVTGKSKKSLENAFAAANKRDEEKENNEVVASAYSSNKAVEAAAAVSNSTTESKQDSKQSSIKINATEYTVVRKLGCGGSSSVYLAQRRDDGKECAVKVVDLRGDPAVVEGYMNETKLLAKLQGNVCVVSLFDYQLLQKESKLFMIMEKGDSDLQKILQGYTTNLPLYELMNYLFQMLQAVNYIHQNGVIHSDLKPANFLMVQGRLKLIDFGIASNIAIDSTSIIKFSQAGTFNYISPEALTDTSSGTSPIRHNQPKIKISTKSDVWSLGCILYLFLYKKTPFSHIKNIYAKITAISSPKTMIEYPGIPAYYPIMLVHMVKNCLQHNPKQRPSCAELLQYPFHMIIPISKLLVPTQANHPPVEKQTKL